MTDDPNNPTISTNATNVTPDDQSSASGDPHAVNVKGERFDVRRSGKHPFVVIPRGAQKEDRMLYMLALVTPLKSARHACSGHLFITGLFLSGKWLDPIGSLEFYTETTKFDSPDTVGLRVDGKLNVSVEEFARSVPQGSMEVVRRHPKLPNNNKHVDTLVVKFRPGLTNVTVGFAHTRKPPTNWLWVNIDGLDLIPQAVGGLLGEDDHDIAATVDVNCEPYDHRHRRHHIPRARDDF
mmetsp:Transcript_52021/g.148285  ORF Transcript_52021/g.148285 Transcript_52021/m.148285 type:complete len:238 (-) Transcript_52021:34-747(-)